MNTRKQPHWLDFEGTQTFFWQYSPDSAEICAEKAVILCPPTGHEYVHTHRTYCRLAEHLAMSGIEVIRLDYPGTGDSSGGLLQSGLLQTWLNVIEELVRYCQSELQLNDITLVGFRLGGNLALEVSRRLGGGRTILVEPIVSGRRYRREITATAKLADSQGQSQGLVEAGGFIYSSEALDFIESLNLDEQSLELLPKVDCFVGRAKKTHRKLELLVNFSLHEFEGYEDMMAEPQYTRVPQPFIEQLVVSVLEHDGQIPSDEPFSGKIKNGLEGEHFRESALVDDLGQIGVLTAPAELTNPSKIVLLINSGSVHHVGPNRLYVELARALSQQGIMSVRLDLKNLGDSAFSGCDHENHCYAPTAVSNAVNFIRYLNRQYPAVPVSVAGICSGAHHAFHSALDEIVEISQVLIINPLTFYWQEGMSLYTPDDKQTSTDTSYYTRIIKQPSSWLKLLKGHVDFVYILGFLQRYIGKYLRVALKSWFRIFKPIPDVKINRDIALIKRHGVDIQFIFSEHDPGWQLLADECQIPKRSVEKTLGVGIQAIPGANHTFSTQSNRFSVIEKILTILKPVSDLNSTPKNGLATKIQD